MLRFAASAPTLRARVACCAAALALVASCAPSSTAAPTAVTTTDPAFAATPIGVTTTAFAEAGDRCRAAFACSSDGMTFLRCDGGRMVVHGLCRGERHCEAGERVARCDQSIAEMGDACDDGASCSVDGLNMLVCRDGRRVLKSACTTGCEVQRKMKTLSCYGTGISR
jgi:hypothetical protein